MHNAVANNHADPFAPLDVAQLRVAGVREATEMLKRERFVFVGAPNRWRRESAGRVSRADIRHGQDGGCVVVLYHWMHTAPEACQTVRTAIGSRS